MFVLNMLPESSGARPRLDAVSAARLLMIWSPDGRPAELCQSPQAYRDGRQSRLGGGGKAVRQNMKLGLADVFKYKTL